MWLAFFFSLSFSHSSSDDHAHSPAHAPPVPSTSSPHGRLEQPPPQPHETPKMLFGGVFFFSFFHCQFLLLSCLYISSSPSSPLANHFLATCCFLTLASPHSYSHYCPRANELLITLAHLDFLLVACRVPRAVPRAALLPLNLIPQPHLASLERWSEKRKRIRMRLSNTETLPPTFATKSRSC